MDPRLPQADLMKELDDLREAVDRLRNRISAARPAAYDRRQLGERRMLADRRTQPRGVATDRRQRHE